MNEKFAPMNDSLSIQLKRAEGGGISGFVELPLKITGKVHLRVFGPDGMLREERKIDNLVVNAGKAYVATILQNAGVTASLLSISSSTNASPIQVTTSTNHNLSTGQNVFIYNHATNTNANGFWVITRVSANQFTLNGSTGNGVGGATGTVAPSISEMQWMAVGTGTTAPAAGDTDLQSEITTGLSGSRVTITRTNPSSQTVQYAATWNPGQATNGAITEAGIFNDTAVGPASGTMLTRATFSAIAKGAGDTLTINWSVSIS